MSVMYIPDELYREIYERQVCRLVDQGLWLFDARIRAKEIMDYCFARHSALVQCESQKDYYDERDGDWTR